MTPCTQPAQIDVVSHGGKGPEISVVNTASTMPDAPRAQRGGVLPTRDGTAGAKTTIHSKVGAGIADAT